MLQLHRYSHLASWYAPTFKEASSAMVLKSSTLLRKLLKSRGLESQLVTKVDSLLVLKRTEDGVETNTLLRSCWLCSRYRIYRI